MTNCDVTGVEIRAVELFKWVNMEQKQTLLIEKPPIETACMIDCKLRLVLQVVIFLVDVRTKRQLSPIVQNVQNLIYSKSYTI